MTGKTSSDGFCPFSDPALCRICSRDCNVRELSDLITKLEEANQRVSSALEEARRRLLDFRADSFNELLTIAREECVEG